ncbi:MAG TPA: peptidylprolyl isomerase [Gemmatimonadaceae bacterium]|nr:peptidylprolyl isomerase [Gemmatimonadaceae bacterium]
MRVTGWMALALAAMLPLAAPVRAQGPAPDTIPFERIVAVVGTKVILWSEVLTEVNQLRAQGQLELPSDSAGQVAVARTVLEQMVDEEVLFRHAEADTGVTVSENEVAQSVDQQIQRIRGQFSTDQEMGVALRSSGFGNIEEYRRFLSDQMRRSELVRRYVAKLKAEGKLPPTPVSEADVTEAFEREKDKLPQRPARVTFRQIVVPAQATEAARAAARAKADSLLVELRAGGDFALIARRESMDETTAERGGDLGWNRRGEMVPAFDRVMFALPPGVVSPVVETTFGFHIIKVDRVQPAEVKARHILIRPVIDSAQVAAAKVRADSVLALWESGVPYDTLAAKYHDPDEVRASLEPFPREQLPESYQAAFQGKGTGDFVEPFAIDDRVRGAKKFVVAHIEESQDGGEFTLADYRIRVRDQLSEERSMRRLIDGLRKQTYVSIRM